MDIVEGPHSAVLLAWVAAAAPMALLPRDLGRQELQMQTISGEVHHVLHDAHGVSIAMVPRLPSSVGEVLEWLGQLHLGDSDRRRLLQAALFLQAWSRSLQRRRRWFYVIRKLYFAGFQCMPVHRLLPTPAPWLPP